MAMAGALGAMASGGTRSQLPRVTAALRVFEARRRGLAPFAWLLDEMRPAGAPPLGFPRPADADEVDEIGWQLVAMIVACLRHYVTGGATAGGTGGDAIGRRLVVLLHLQTGTNRDTAVSLWTWRTAAAVCELCAQRQLPRLIMCVVMRRQNLIHVQASAWEEAILTDVEASYGAIVGAAEASSTLLALQPLTSDARDRYVYEVLTAKHGYTGSRAGVPAALLGVVSELAAGHPKHIEEVLQSLFDAGVISVTQRATGAVVTTMGSESLRRVPLPRRMQATLLQHFDALEASLQALLKAVSPLEEGWSEGVLAALGLPPEVTGRAAHLLSIAVADGLIEEVMPLPAGVLAADPGARRAWRWTQLVMREQVLANVLQTERARVLQCRNDLIEHHKQVARRVERAHSAFRRMHSEHRSGWTTTTTLHESSSSSSTGSGPSSIADEIALVDELSDVGELRRRLKAALLSAEHVGGRRASRRRSAWRSTRFTSWLRLKMGKASGGAAAR